MSLKKKRMLNKNKINVILVTNKQIVDKPVELIMVSIGLFPFIFLSLSFLSININAVDWRPVVLMHGITADASVFNEVLGWLQSDFPGFLKK